jgi:hypothetical protein
MKKRDCQIIRTFSKMYVEDGTVGLEGPGDGSDRLLVELGLSEDDHLKAARRPQRRPQRHPAIASEI